MASLLCAAGPLSQEQSTSAAPKLSPEAAQGLRSNLLRIVDLTYPLSEKFPAWPGDPRVFEAKVNASVEKDGYFTRHFWMLEHFSTHMDAPAHFPPGKTTVDEITPESLVGPAVVLDIQEQGAKNSDYRVSVSDIQAWEKRNGRIPAGAIVLLRTGWARRVNCWGDEGMPRVLRRPWKRFGEAYRPGSSGRLDGAEPAT